MHLHGILVKRSTGLSMSKEVRRKLNYVTAACQYAVAKTDTQNVMKDLALVIIPLCAHTPVKQCVSYALTVCFLS